MKPWAPPVRPGRGTYPLHGLQLNRAHPLARGLFFLAVGDFEFVNQRFADYKRSGGLYEPIGAIGPRWRSWLPSATLDNAMGWDNIPNPPQGNSGHTILSYMNPQKSLQSYGAFVSFSPDPGAQAIGLSLFGWEPAAKALYRWETAGGTVSTGPTSGDFWQLSTDAYRSARVFGAAYSPEDQAVHFYRDGRFFETLLAVTSSPFEAGEFHAALGNVQAQDADGNEAFADFYVTAAWRRTLTPTEHRLFAENPYALLERRVVPVAFMPIESSGVTTGTGASSMSPAISAATGGRAVVGSAAASSGASVTSATGQRVSIGQGAAAAPAGASSATGRRIVFGAGEGSVAATLTASSGRRVVAGTGAPELPEPVTAGREANVVSGVADASMPDPVSSAAGQRVVSGAAGAAQSAPITEAFARRIVIGTAVAVAPASISAGAEAGGARGIVSAIAPVPVSSAAGRRVVRGVGAAAITAPISAGTQSNVVRGTAAAIMASPVAYATGRRIVIGQGAALTPAFVTHGAQQPYFYRYPETGSRGGVLLSGPSRGGTVSKYRI